MTINDGLFIITIFAALGCGLMAGVFFVFSTSIMKALSLLPWSEGMAAMQFINITIINPLFLLVFMGTALLSAILIVLSLLRWQEPASVYLLIGAILYLVGSFLVTAGVNVPKNNALAALTLTDPNGPGFWARYLVEWRAWNHLRTLSALAALAFFILALCQ